MRRDILGLGAAQWIITSAAIFGLAYLTGVNWRGALIVGVALALSATAIALQILEERGSVQQTYAQRAIAILLFQDITIVPLLALLPLLAPGSENACRHLDRSADAGGLGGGGDRADRVRRPLSAQSVFQKARRCRIARSDDGGGVAGRARRGPADAKPPACRWRSARSWPAFCSRNRISVMSSKPISSRSADCCSRLFFMGVGMSIDLTVVRANWLFIVGGRFGRHDAQSRHHLRSVRPDLRAARRCDPRRVGSHCGRRIRLRSFPDRRLAHAAVCARGQSVRCHRRHHDAAWAIRRDADGKDSGAAPRKHEQQADDFSDASGSVLIIGFGRFGQVVAQCLLSQGVDVTAIDDDSEMIDAAGRFGFKLYYGDGARLDVLRAAGAERVKMIAVCVEQYRARANRIVDLINEQFPDTKLYVRSYDRGHTLDLIKKGVNFELRETFKSALAFGRAALEGLGVDAERAQAVEDEVRRPRSRAPRAPAGRRPPGRRRQAAEQAEAHSRAVGRSRPPRARHQSGSRNHHPRCAEQEGGGDVSLIVVARAGGRSSARETRRGWPA